MMNIGRSYVGSGVSPSANGRPPSVMPPCEFSDEKIWWCVSTYMMSLNFVIDQYGPNWLSRV